MSGQFSLTAATKVCVDFADLEQKNTAQWLVNQLNTATGFSLQLSDLSKGLEDNSIVFRQTPNLWGAEGYQLDVLSNRITLEGSSDRGCFYALQTLLQLLPPSVFASQKADGVSWQVSCCHVEDRPRYAYRGMHLDVGRHFFAVSIVKKYIDLMALHKFNTFHWHLTDDQGWRIEIKKYPLLTQVGSRRSKTILGHVNQNYPAEYDVREYGGFYTQSEIKEVVAYAQSKFVTIIPEIDMPGHAKAILAAYPELSCEPTKPYEVATEWGVFDDMLCPSEKTFKFVQDVLTEITALFPGKYIHLGGDECTKSVWKTSKVCQELMKRQKLKDENELQSYFFKRIEKFLTTKGRTLVGWDEILEGGIAPNAIVMSWRGVQVGIEATKQGHDVIMTPQEFCCFNCYQTSPAQEPLAQGGLLPLEKVYRYEPTPKGLSPELEKRILGAQANVWTEYIDTPDYLDYMTQPRQAAMAEALWSTADNKNYDDFVKRLNTHLKRLTVMNVNFANSLFDITVLTQAATRGELKVSLATGNSDAKISYSLTPVVEEEGVDYDTKTKQYNAPFLLNDHTLLKAQSEAGKQLERKILVHKAVGKRYSVTDSTFKADSTLLTDGLQALSPRSHIEWVIYPDKDLELTVDLGENRSIKKVYAQFLKSIMEGVFPPTLVEVWTAKDGEEFKLTSSLPVSYDLNGPWKTEPVELNFKTVRARFVRLKAKNAGLCPVGHPKVGKPTSIGIDEIGVE